MKKLSVLICLFTLFFAFTCENEPLDFDAESSQTDSDLLGDWSLVEFSVQVSHQQIFKDK